MRVDELKIIPIKDDLGNTYELKANFRALKKLNNLVKGLEIDNKKIDNFFEALTLFCSDVNARLELLPYYIKAMLVDNDLTVEYIEDHILGMTLSRTQQITAIIFEILEIELKLQNDDTEQKQVKERKKK